MGSRPFTVFLVPRLPNTHIFRRKRLITVPGLTLKNLQKQKTENKNSRLLFIKL